MSLTATLPQGTLMQGKRFLITGVANDWSLAWGIAVHLHAQGAALRKNTNLRHISLYKNNVPIASSSLSMHDSIARIDDVATCMAYQGRGYATALMRYTISEAKQGGARYCFLESSDLGLGLYLRLGFKPLFTNILYRMERA